MVTFNELLLVHGIDPAQTILLRHSKTGSSGHTTHDLWQRNDGSFDLYQSTQGTGRRFELPYWASFVSTPANETLFVGLYGATKGDHSKINWDCPMIGLPPGADKGRTQELYDLQLLEAMEEHRGRLKIEWDKGWIAWSRRAYKSNHLVVGTIDTATFDRFEASPEGQVSWHTQRRLERDSKLATDALAKNASAHDGYHTCEACGFRHPDRGMLDAHHTHPVSAGARITRSTDLVVLCPTCHRRAHHKANRMLPHSLTDLRAWNTAGRV